MYVYCPNMIAIFSCLYLMIIHRNHVFHVFYGACVSNCSQAYWPWRTHTILHECTMYISNVGNMALISIAISRSKSHWQFIYRGKSVWSQLVAHCLVQPWYLFQHVCRQLYYVACTCTSIYSITRVRSIRILNVTRET